AEVSERMRAIEESVNRALLPAGRFRQWDPAYRGEGPFEAKIPWERIPAELEALERELFRRWESVRKDPVPVAAWLEWTIQGPLHPYYDGCGRISRGFSAWILIWADHPVPRYKDREEWFRRAREGLESFTAFVRESASR
ncbi:MAG: hypothetical protein AB1758_37445, partial [Candidatus Eremiobacterota bacterium]